MTTINIDIRTMGATTHPDDRVILYAPEVRARIGGGLVSTAPSEIPLTNGQATITNFEPGPVLVRFECLGIADTTEKLGIVPDSGTVSLEDILALKYTWTPPVVSMAIQMIIDEMNRAVDAVENAVYGEIGQRLGVAEGEITTLDGRVDGLEAIAGLAAESPIDGQTANLISQTGTLTRAALENIFSGRLIIDARDHGVVADGVTDDSAAWNALVASSAPGTVITWVGKSMLDAKIVWKSGVSLIGQGWGSSILATRDTTGSVYFSAIQATAAEGFSKDNVMVGCLFSNFEIDGSGLSGTAANISGKAIFTQFTRSCQFLNLYLHDTVATALGTDFMPDCLIDGLLVERGGRNWNGAAGGHAGIGIGMGQWEVENVIISNNTVVDCGHWGIFVEYQEGDPYRSRGAKIIGNTVRGSRGKGIGDRGCVETIIANNHVSGVKNGHGVHVSLGATGGIISDNIISDNFIDGIRFDVDTGDSWRVSGNKILRNGGRGIYFDGPTSAATFRNHSFENNDLSRNGYQGLLIDGSISVDSVFSGFSIKNNKCWNNGQKGTQNDGIKLEADFTNISIIGNQCWDDQATKTQGVGLRLSDATATSMTDGLIAANVLVGNATTGFARGGMVITNVQFENNVGAGAVVESRGSATFADGAATVTVPHNLGVAPTYVQVTPTGNGQVWVQTKGTANVVYQRAVTTGALGIDWVARRGI